MDSDAPAIDADDHLIAALGQGMSYAKAADAVGCSVATVKRRMSSDTFRSRVAEARQATAREALETLEGLTFRAVARLAELVDSTNDLVAIKATMYVVDRAAERRQARELAGRLEQLEANVEQVLDQQQRGPRAVA